MNKKVFSAEEWEDAVRASREFKGIVKPPRSAATERFYSRPCPDCGEILEFHGGVGGGAGMVYLIFACSGCRALFVLK